MYGGSGKTMIPRGVPRTFVRQIDKPFLNFVKSNQNQIVFTIFQYICNQTEFCLAPNQSERCNYNSNLV